MSLEQLREHRKVWDRKPALRRVYGEWFDALLETAGRGDRVLEVGAGPGFLGAYARARRPDVRWVSSELVETPWNDVVADGLRLPVRSGSLDVVMGLDVLHHLADPRAFFEEVARVLRPGGRLCAVEPWVTPLSFPVYRFTHPEGCSLGLDPWRPFGVSRSADKSPFAGDNACVWLLHRRTTGARWTELGFEPPAVTLYNGFAYLLSLGFRPPSLLPQGLAPLMVRADRLASALAPALALRARLCWVRRLAAGAAG